MVLFLGMFLVNTLCAIVPCQKLYAPPVPVPKDGRKTDTLSNWRNPILETIKVPILEPDESQFVVRVTSGLLRGFPMQTIRARDIVAFTGIPYAEPPVMDLRYRAPVPKKPWKGVLLAVDTPQDCMQIDGMQLLRIVGSEDCLYANVYTPILPRGNFHPKLPVLIFFHGGSFAFSSGSSFGPAYLLDRDVILVTFNYRLSSFGFLSTGDEVAPGNWGMKDQTLLIKWVNQNIEAFGGDRNQITLFGQSAGAVSVHLHILSKQSRGLFRAGISQSGNAFCFWGVRENSIDYTYRLANALRCPVNESASMVDCLRRLDPLLIAYTESTLPHYKVFPGVFFGPILEPKGEEAFLEERPEVLYAQNKVPPIPWINGFLADEGNGVGFLAWLYPFVMQEINQKWSVLGPKILDLTGDIQYVSPVVSQIRQFYFGNQPINHNTKSHFTQMMGDRLIMAAVHKGLKYHSRIAPTYGYFFNFTGKYGTAASHGLNIEDWGISHDDDLIYLLNSTTYHALRVGEPEYEMSEFLTNVWANFAIHGEPNFETDDGREIHFWDNIKDFRRNDMPVVLLNGDMPKMIKFPFQERIKFWDDLGLVSRSKVGRYTLPSSKPAKSSSMNVQPQTFFDASSSSHQVRPFLSSSFSTNKMFPIKKLSAKMAKVLIHSFYLNKTNNLL